MRANYRWLVVTCILLLMLSLIACQTTPKSRQYVIGKKSYVWYEMQGSTVTYISLDGNSKIIVTIEPDPRWGMDRSRYRVDIDGDIYLVAGTYDRVVVTFPDGREASKLWNNNSAGLTGDHLSFDEWDMFDGFRAMLFNPPQQSTWNVGTFFLGFVVIGIGIFSVSNPRFSWYLNRGWMYRDAEPSDLYLGLTQVGGVVTVLVGIGLILGSF